MSADDESHTESRERERPRYQVWTIRDEHGIRQGTIERRADGEVIIKDQWGIRRGMVSPAR